ncbi:uncharacterized protein LOC116230699 [Phasianus colchicus]|uniref:uncharacterized protein LOC116230699 n=1 Tax=Phasianus colchicus TaxID=9054 RepID=UPI00129D344C|nr:uncharacterized protein LOC116230699 [Phasianus colchicus]
MGFDFGFDMEPGHHRHCAGRSPAHAATALLPPQHRDPPEPPPPPPRNARDAPRTGSSESQWARPAAPASTNRSARGRRGSAESVAAVANDEGAYRALRRLPRSFPPSGGGGCREPYLRRTWRRGRWGAGPRSARGGWGERRRRRHRQVRPENGVGNGSGFSDCGRQASTSSILNDISVVHPVSYATDSSSEHVGVCCCFFSLKLQVWKCTLKLQESLQMIRCETLSIHNEVIKGKCLQSVELDNLHFRN